MVLGIDKDHMHFSFTFDNILLNLHDFEVLPRLSQNLAFEACVMKLSNFEVSQK